jgi:phosphoribosyl 1,2-cyclic phosphodiesterase/ActR/RegA family two-component response regulator
MAKKKKFFLVDDDRIFIKLLSRFLQPIAETISSCTSGLEAIPQILETRPDCVVLDMMMPVIDGLETLKRLRSEPTLKNLKIIIISGKSYEFDRKRAYEFGADGYMVKPVDPDTICSDIIRIVEDKIELAFWGTHGTIPVPGRQTVRYGGNTSCVSLEFPKGNFFIFDAGTGIKVLSDHLMAQNHFPMEAKLFISHPHWDHINGLPFFAPLYMQGNEIQIFGPSHGDITMRELISGQMDGVYFPINIKEFSAMVYFRDLMEEELKLDDITIQTLLLNHPGHCLGYRVTYKTRSICYITDNELYPEGSRFYNPYFLTQLTEFTRNADALITDCTYSDLEYPEKIGWGHSAVGQAATLAHQAGVKMLYLFHHDPSHTDDHIDAKVTAARDILNGLNSSTQCMAPEEKQTFKI